MRWTKNTLQISIVSSLLIVGCGKKEDSTTNEGVKKEEAKVEQPETKKEIPATPEPKAQSAQETSSGEVTPEKVKNPVTPKPAPAVTPAEPRPEKVEPADVPPKEEGQLPIDILKRRAEGGEAKAQFELGDRYAQGIGLEADLAEAVKWYLKAAEQGRADAQYNLGMMYQSGHGVTKDPVEAAKWFRMADESNRENN